MAAERHDLDVIILDTGLTDFSVVKLLSKLREVPAHAETPVLLGVNSCGVDEARAAVQRDGHAVIIVHPFTKMEVWYQLKELGLVEEE